MKRDLVWLLALGMATAGGFWLGGAGEPDGPLRSEFDREREPVERESRPTGSTDAPDSASLPPDAPVRPGARELWEEKIGQPPSDQEWERIRAEAEAARERYRRAAEMAEIVAAQRLAEERLDEQKRLEDAQRGGTMALLRGLSEKPARLPRLVADPEAFAEHFERQSPDVRVDGPSLTAGDEIPDGAVVEYGAGVFALNTGRVLERGRFPKDLLLVGVGKDQTLLRIKELNTGDEVVSLTFRDLTLDCNGDHLTDFRSRKNPATIRLDRCRIVGWDNGAGGSTMFDARTGAFYASDCDFEAGYATGAGFGNMFRVRSGLLARLEHCRIIGPFRSLYDANNAATYHFVGCEIRDTTALLARCKTDPGSGVTFDKCALVELAGNPRGIRRSLADINPDWPARKR